MKSLLTEYDLTETIRALQTVLRELEQEASKLLAEPSLRLSRLHSVVADLGQAKPAKSVRCPEEYVKQWNRFVDNEEQPLERRTVRYLCWQPEIATSQRFQYYLDRADLDLNARSLQGLVRCCHARWSPEFAKSQVATRVRYRVETYKGANHLLTLWSENSTVILGLKGAEAFGSEMVQKLQGIKAHCASYWISDETSAYVQIAVRHAAELCRHQLDRVPEMRQYLLGELLPWNGWAPDVFKEEISQVVLHEATARSERVRESVRRAILDDPRLGDPRLPRNRLNWIGIGEAERRLIEWLSQLDIGFFFEHVLPSGKDPHGRKDFWLRYVSKVQRSRPLLTWNDRYRLKQILQQKGQELAHFGLMESDTSAFLLDFGPILAVEFSAVGNACYLYRKNEIAKVVPDFWSSRPFYASTLKQPQLCLERIVHRKGRSAWRGGWREETAQILAKFGVKTL